MTPDLVRRMSSPVPRYTSYPTAASFTPSVGAGRFAQSLATLPASATLSLYVHIPFCAKLCWYCGCNTKVVHGAEAVTRYLAALKSEMAAVAAKLGATRRVSHLHWGGGSPNFLTPAQIIEVAGAIREHFALAPAAEFAVEIDPRWFSAEQAGAFATAGVTRVSIGVQDFDPAVQKAINREQSFDLTRKAVELVRAAGIASVNVDLVYGLPHQTRASVERTIEQTISLAPDRVALFGYAHLPSRIKHQALIDETALPNVVERFAQSRRARRLLRAAGYVAVGLDHFATADDALAQGSVRRNFQGYTTDEADALIGLGASAISQMPDGYYQNAVARPEYEKRIADTGLATARGVVLTEEDRMRAFVIEKLMCEFTLSKREVRSRFGKRADPILDEADDLLSLDQDALLEKTSDGFRLTPRGEPFVRSIAACFDSYLGREDAKFSTGV
jgi:oxygen-independent coproporphyrinogen III oxidase